MNHRKPTLALMSYALDNRRARGIALYARKLIEGLIEDGRFEIYLVHYEKVNDPLYRRAHEIIMPELRLPFATRFVRTMLFFLTYRGERFDIMHWFQPRVYPFFWLAPARKIVITLHGAGDITAPGHQIFSRRAYNFILKHFNRWVDAAIAVSQHARQAIITHYHFPPDKVKVTYNGGGELYSALDKDESRRHIAAKYSFRLPFMLDISRPEPHKNLDRLVQAYEIFRRDNPSSTHTLVIAGGAPESYGEVRTRALRSPYAADIQFAGFIAGGDLNAFYAAAELFVFPSVDEGFGLPVVEAFASGTPVVTSDASCLPEIAGDAGILVDPHDPASIAEAMHRVLSNHALRKTMIARGLVRAHVFTWKSTTDATIKIYQTLLKNAS